jgi:hypothetical protein
VCVCARVRECSTIRFLLMFWHYLKWSHGSSGSIVSDYGLDDRGSIPDRGRGFLLAPTSRLALGPTQPPVQWVPGVLSPGVKRGRGVTLTIHPNLVPRMGMSRSYTSPPPQTPSWRVAGQLILLFETIKSRLIIYIIIHLICVFTFPLLFFFCV